MWMVNNPSVHGKMHVDFRVVARALLQYVICNGFEVAPMGGPQAGVYICRQAEGE